MGQTDSRKEAIRSAAMALGCGLLALTGAGLGLGKLGLFHSGILGQLPDAELAAVVDADPKMGARAGSIGLSAPFYKSFEEMIGREEIDAAFVCTPTFLHFPLVEEASAHGVHLFVEKPFTESHGRSSELLSVVDAAGVRCAVGYVLAYHPTFRRQTDLVREGAIGRVAGLSGRSVQRFMLLRSPGHSRPMSNCSPIVLSSARPSPKRPTRCCR